MVAGDNNRLAVRRQILQQLGGFRCGGLVVDQVTQNNQALRPIFIYQRQQALRNRRHPPHRDKTARCALAEFIAKMQVGHGEPPLGLVEKREPPIKQDLIGDKRLIGT
jgi:hypothetical protein